MDNMEPSGTMDGSFRMIVILGLFGWIVFEGLSLRTPYPSTIVALWDSPLWRLVLLFTVWLGAEWCPRVGLLTSIAVVMYIINMIQIS
jgi:hypothetical protein